MAQGSLSGRTVVITRPRHQADDLRAPLEERGARTLLFPTIEIVPPDDGGPLLEAAGAADTFDWIVFTSVNGVEAFRGALLAAGVTPRSLGESDSPRFAAIGPATGSAITRLFGARPRVVPGEYVAEAVVEALDEADDLRGKRILLPRAAEAREALPRGLRERGARVKVVHAYRSVMGPGRANPGEGTTASGPGSPSGTDPASGAGIPVDPDELRDLLDRGEVDLVTFTASSTVRNFHALLGPDLGGAAVVVIGPITAGTARELGYQVDAVADPYTIPGLVEACERWGRERS